MGGGIRWCESSRGEAGTNEDAQSREKRALYKWPPRWSVLDGRISGPRGRGTALADGGVDLLLIYRCCTGCYQVTQSTRLNSSGSNVGRCNSNNKKLSWPAHSDAIEVGGEVIGITIDGL